MPVKFHIITYGCQMNRYDSLALRESLQQHGHIWSDKPENADLIVVNTCAVRKHAEDRAIGRLRELAGIKKHRKYIMLGIMGCVAQELGENIIAHIPEIDFIVGTDQIMKIVDIAESNCPSDVFIDCNTHFTGLGTHAYIEPSQMNAFVTIMRGCDNFCSYCIVPYVRGRERSRRIKQIIDEIKYIVNIGVREVILLGQNVNSYNYENTRFPVLLDRIAKINGLQRIRFVTNHPKDFSQEVLDVVQRNNSKIPAAFHLPLQSGSSAILKAMNRKYNFEQYMNIVENIYNRFPDAAITTDLMVGFPGESEDDFRATVDAIKKIGFAGIFAFKYSPRPGTAAQKLENDISESEKLRRLRIIIDDGIELAEKYSRKLVGTMQDVLVEAEARKNPGMLRGTAPCGRTVIIPKDGARNIGMIIPVKIHRASTWVLWGS